MRTLIVSVAVAVAALGFCTVSGVQKSLAQAKQPPVTRPRWEYKLVTVKELVKGLTVEDEVGATLEKHFNTFGDDGWELCQDLNGGLIFKRTR